MENTKIDIQAITDKIIKSYGKEERYVIPILQALQNEMNYLPEEALKRVCAVTNIKPSRILSVATFYSNFRLEEAGKHIVKVCTGTACHIKGAEQVFDSFKRYFGIDNNANTDAKGLFTIEKVACLGCCTIAPVVQISDHTFGHATPENVSDIIDDFLERSFTIGPSGKKIKEMQQEKIQGEVRVGLGSCCVASGSSDVHKELMKSIQDTGIRVNVKQVGCIGMCHQVPLLEIQKPNQPTSFYNKIKPNEIRDILLTHFRPTNPFNQFRNTIYTFFETVIDHKQEETKNSFTLQDKNISPFLDKQLHIATEGYGQIKPLDFEEYKKYEGFRALKKALVVNSENIIEVVRKSGIRGKGGGGFLSGDKWELVKKANSNQKYVICNGDEGDPGAFMDRMLIESYPFRIIEGMIIAGYAIGASKGFLYIRAEYPLAVKTMNKALQIAYENHLLGERILNSNFSFDLEIFEGAGAFVCGEETALIKSIEGERGNPIYRPPYPAEKGLWNKPTLINNAETFASIPWIIRNGAEKYAGIGTQKSKGTKVFALAGKIKKGGLIEVPMGITIKEIVEDIGDGINENKKFKAVQIGGPSGGCIPAKLADNKIDFESLIELGAMMGSGGLIVMDETDCMVDIAKYFLSFTQDQSCGKCTFCRIGTKRMLEILERITAGKGKMEDLDTLESLAKNIKTGSLCGLGRTAPNPVISTLKYFRDEYIAHIEGKCPAKKCEDLITYTINEDCIGCSKCAQRCPSDAIEGNPHEVYKIDPEKCIKCDICRQVCPYEAVEKK